MLPVGAVFTESLLEAMIDPMTSKPMRNAHELNCGEGTDFANHLFDFETANNILSSTKTCPLCRRRVTIARPNQALQTLINAILGVEQGEEHVKKVLGVIQEKVETMRLNKDFYPLSPSTFTYKSLSHWRGISQFDVVDSSNKTDCIKTFSIKVNKNNRHVELSLSFSSQEHMNPIKEALQKKESEPVNVVSQMDTQTYRLEYHFFEKEVIDILNYFIKHNIFVALDKATLIKFIEIIDKIDF